jgi:hypothetical protein
MLGAQFGEYAFQPNRPASSRTTLEHALQFYYELLLAHPN